MHLVIAKSDTRRPGEKFRCDCPALPGTPPVGLGETPLAALGDWFWQHQKTVNLTVEWPPEDAPAIKPEAGGTDHLHNFAPANTNGFACSKCGFWIASMDDESRANWERECPGVIASYPGNLPVMPVATCGTCSHAAKSPRHKGYVECHRFPPSNLVEGLGWAFPLIEEAASCGEYNAAFSIGQDMAG